MMRSFFRGSRGWLAASLTSGVLWLVLLFAIDANESMRAIKRSSRHIRADKTTMQILESGVQDYLIGVAAGYLLLGLLLGALLFFSTRLVFRARPSTGRLFVTLVGISAGLTVATYAHQAMAFPALHGWWSWRTWWCNTFELWQIDAAIGASLGFAVIVTGVRARRDGWLPDWTRRLLQLASVGVGLALIFSNPAPRPAVLNEGPNVVFIGVDSLRPDHVGYHGYTKAQTPNMDALLAESVVFESAWTSLGRTYPSWLSILTGTLPITHGIRDNLPEQDKLLPKVAWLPGQLQAEGVHTTYVGDDSRFSYMVEGPGWDAVLEPKVGVANFAVSMNEPRFRAFHAFLHNPIGFALTPSGAYNQAFGRSYRPDLFAKKASDQLALSSQHGRFFYAIHSSVLHVPGDRPYPWHKMYGQSEYTGHNRFKYSRSGSKWVVEEEATGEPINRVADQDRRLYDSGVDMADRLVGELVGQLKQSGLWENTIVVFLSDHGEEHWAPELAYSYGGPNHGFHVYGDAQYRVEMAIHFPDGAYAGQRVEAPVRLIDLVPTLADVLKMDWPSPFDGQSLMPLIRGESEPAPREVYIETGLSEPRYWSRGHLRYPFKRMSQRYQVDPDTERIEIKPKFRPYLIAAKDRILQVGDWKLVWLAMKDGERVQLFNRVDDPYNLVDLSQRMPEKVQELGQRLRVYLEKDGIETTLFDDSLDGSEEKEGVFQERSMD